MSRRLMLVAALAVLMAAASVRSVDAVTPVAPSPAVWGARTVGGEGGETILVTNLDDDGEGSLRAALAVEGRRTVRFAVAGTIRLAKPLVIRHPLVTVAGETAPSPGITLWGASVRIKASDVILRHLRIRIGDGPGQPPDDRDGITILGDREGKRITENVLIEHCSVSWTIDEGISLWFPNVRAVTIRDTIISESLDRSIHPKGQHSMALLIGPDSQNVLIEGNLLAHNRWRNPVLTAGVTAAVVNNLIYDPGNQAVHFYGNEGARPTLAAIVGNVVRGGPSSQRRLDMFGSQGLSPGSRIYLHDNLADGVIAFEQDSPKAARLAFKPFVVRSPVTLGASIRPKPAHTVAASVTATAGARPWDRDSTDRRIIGEVGNRSGQIRDTVPDGEGRL